MSDLWVCPKCGNLFVTANTWHSCGVFTLDDLFSRSEPQVREAYDAFESAARSMGEIRVVPQKTRVVFQTRTRFAGGIPKRDHFDASFIFFRKCEDSRFHRIEDYGRWQGHRLKLRSAEDVDERVRAWLREAKRYGDQVGPA